MILRRNMVNKYFFTSTWCSNCSIVKPIVEKLDDVEIINVDEREDLVKKFTIMSLPTYIHVVGEEVKEMNGVKPKEIIEEFYGKI
jgi:thioredoxin-like negative regulator of GroEL